MRTFKNILAVWNQMPEGMEVVKRAVDLARKSRGRVTVLEVMPRFTVNVLGQMDPAGMGLRLQMLHEARSQLKRRISLFFQDSPHIRAKVVMGDPVRSVVSEVMRNGHDVVIVSGRAAAPGWQNKPLEDNFAAQLMRVCPGPVWIVKPGSYRRRLKRVLAPLHPGLFHLQTAGLINRRILRLAASVASLEKSELHLLDASRVSRPGFAPASRAGKAFLRQAHFEPRLRRDAALRGFELKNIRTRVHEGEGNAEEIISRLARQYDIDLIVMGVAPRSAMPALVPFETAARLAADAPCSILTVKPEMRLPQIMARSETVNLPAEAAA